MSDLSDDDVMQAAARWYSKVLKAVEESADEIYGVTRGADPAVLSAQFVQSLARRGFQIEESA